MFDGVMAVVGQIWVEGQCHKKDEKMCCPKVPCLGSIIGGKGRRSFADSVCYFCDFDAWMDVLRI